MKRNLLFFCLLLTILSVSARQNRPQPDFTNPETRIPVDPDVRTGRLDNGLTYYIRHNENPKGQADFYIIHNVGAIQENDSQQGLAHFLEHMAFNGTKNLPDKTLIEYLEKIGVKFGANLNAATSWDQTVYNIAEVPTSREGIIDSCLLILHDWSHFIALESEEIDSERGVIMEELRSRDGAAWRSSLEMLKAVGRGTRYEHRNLIGYLDFLGSFDHQALRDFYHTWYRPDYQAVVVVGDLDTDIVEAKIRKLMSDIPGPAADAPKKDVIVVPDNEEPIISIFTDREMQGSRIQLFIKHPRLPREQNERVKAEMKSIIEYYVTAMENARLQEIAMRPAAPFLAADVGTGGIGLIPTLDAVAFSAATRDGELAGGFEALLTEMERMRRYGFTQGEFERAKQELMRSCERRYATRGERYNSEFVQACLAHYQHNRMMPDAETEWKMDSTLLQHIDLKAVNEYAARCITPANQVIVVAAPEKEGVPVPTAGELLAIRNRVAEAEIAPFEDTAIDRPLIPEGTDLKGAPVRKSSFDKTYGTTEWTLANGARIVAKPTTFKTDEIQMAVVSDGGLSLLSDEEYWTGQLLESVVSFSGAGDFSATELQKVLTGKVASVGVSIGDYSNGVGGFCSPQDLETMLQLVYLNFTQPRFDEEDFDTLMSMLRTRLENAQSDPGYEYQKRMLKLVYGNHPRRQTLSPEVLEKVSFAALPASYHKLYPGARGFTFIFVGNIDLAVLRPLAEKYIGSIPDQKKALKYADDKVRPVSGMHTEEFGMPMQQPKVSVACRFSGKIANTLENRLTLSFLSQALTARYRESIREEKGGTYGVSVSGSVSHTPVDRYGLQISFDTNEEMVEELRDIVRQEIREMADKGPDGETMEKIRGYLRKNWESGLEQNGNWLSFISDWKFENLDYVSDYLPALEAVSSSDVQRLAKKILADGNLVNLVMRPETPEVPDTKAEQPAETASDELFDIEECRKAAGEGDVAACRTLGEYYENPKDESIQPRNLYAAQNWYRKAADSGDSEAEYLLACSYLNLCEDLEEPRPDDLRNALHWFRRAAGQGHAGAQERLAAWSGEVAAVTAQPDAPLSCGRGKDRSVIDDYAKLLNTFDAAMSHGTRLVTSPKDKGVIVGRTRYEELRKELLTGDRYGAATYRAALDSLQAHHTIRSFQDMARDYMFTMLQKFYDERPIEWSQPRKTGKGCYEMTDMKTLFIYVIEEHEEGIRICRKESGEE